MFKDLKAGLKGLLYEDVTEEPSKQPTAPVVSSVPPAPVVSNAPVAPAASDYSEIDKLLQGRLLAALESADAKLYQELDSFLDTMADAIPDENVRWKKGVELLSKRGYTIPLILSDIDKCIGVVEEHGRVFAAEMAKQLKDRVGSREQSVQTLSQQIQAKEAQLAALQSEITALQQKRDTDQAAISTEQVKVERFKNRFNVVYPAVMAEVQSHRTKLASFLPKDPS